MRALFICYLLSTALSLICTPVIAQRTTVSASGFIERAAWLNTVGLRLGYDLNAQVTFFGEVRDRQIGFFRLATPCLILDPEVYPQVAFLDPDFERIALLPSVKGNAPIALGVTLKGKRRFSPFISLRGEVVRFNFRATTVRQVYQSRGTTGLFGPYWNSKEKVFSETSARRIAGSLQVGFSFTGKKGWITYSLYGTADRYSTGKIDLAVLIAGYPDIEGVTLHFRDHYASKRYGLGFMVSVNFGRDLNKDTYR